MDRLEEGFENLRKIGSKVKGGKSQDFVKYLLAYVRNTWMDGTIPRELWNMFNHKGVTTNNNAESLNNKLGSKNKLKSHPNPYLLVDEVKNQLLIARDQKIVQINRSKRRQASKSKNLERRRASLMKDISKGYTDLLSYQISIGSLSMKFDSRI